jgi:hypothetical protein
VTPAESICIEDIIAVTYGRGLLVGSCLISILISIKVLMLQHKIARTMLLTQPVRRPEGLVIVGNPHRVFQLIIVKKFNGEQLLKGH